jgi:hypothetical protein
LKKAQRARRGNSCLYGARTMKNKVEEVAGALGLGFSSTCGGIHGTLKPVRRLGGTKE